MVSDSRQLADLRHLTADFRLLAWEQFAGFDVKQAKDNKRLLGVVRDLLIMGKKVKGES